MVYVFEINNLARYNNSNNDNKATSSRYLSFLVSLSIRIIHFIPWFPCSSKELLYPSLHLSLLQYLSYLNLKLAAIRSVHPLKNFNCFEYSVFGWLRYCFGCMYWFSPKNKNANLKHIYCVFFSEFYALVSWQRQLIYSRSWYHFVQCRREKKRSQYNNSNNTREFHELVVSFALGQPFCDSGSLLFY